MNEALCEKSKQIIENANISNFEKEFGKNLCENLKNAISEKNQKKIEESMLLLIDFIIEKS